MPNMCGDFWDAFSAVWTARGVIVTFASVILAILALFSSIKTFNQSLNTLHYTELDKMYLDLLRIRLETPHLNNPCILRNPSQEADYRIYAHMVWNFLETIHDRCERDKSLWVTWYPVIETENRLHRQWFDKSENEHKFKDNFISFIREGKFKEKLKNKILERANNGKLTDQDVNSVTLKSIFDELDTDGYLRGENDNSSVGGPNFTVTEKGREHLDELKRKRSISVFKDEAKKIGISLFFWILVIVAALIILITGTIIVLFSTELVIPLFSTELVIPWLPKKCL